jgi:hypothetical protein
MDRPYLLRLCVVAVLIATWASVVGGPPNTLTPNRGDYFGAPWGGRTASAPLLAAEWMDPGSRGGLVVLGPRLVVTGDYLRSAGRGEDGPARRLAAARPVKAPRLMPTAVRESASGAQSGVRPLYRSP